MVFCTLFDSNYIDKGVVMYESLRKLTNDFVIYVLPMDEQCKDVLKKINFDKLIVVDPDEFFSTMNLWDIKNNRPRAEFCWTCTSHLIDYVLNIRNEKICTYVDSDLFFYCNPKVLLDEMGEKSVQIIKHGFDGNFEDRRTQKAAGTYCVEFNTFKKEKESIQLLKWWEEQCRTSCANNKDDGVFGDQKYLEGWEKYSYVQVLNNPGGGVAPWNVGQYQLVSSRLEDGEIVLKKKKTRQEFSLVFYHFHNITYLETNKVDIAVFERKWGTDSELINIIYIPYLLKLNVAKEMLRDQFGVYPLILSHPGLDNNTASIKEKMKKLKLTIKKYGLLEGIATIIVSVNAHMREIINRNKNVISF